MIEHYVTLFDHKFILMGMALRRSLERNAGDQFMLWVVCMDELVYTYLVALDLAGVKPVRMSDVETAELLGAKQTRPWREYCWTLTPYVCLHILRMRPDIRQVTYIDADLFFFKSPQPLIDELSSHGKDVLVTEHDFDPRYAAASKRAGRFCVQFQTFKNTRGACEVLCDWASKCLADCSANGADGIFGDQKYVEEWPTRFPDQTHVLLQRGETLAPWNVDFYMKKRGEAYFPILYHFHGLRILGPKWARLYGQYSFDFCGHIYDAYLAALRVEVQQLKERHIPVPFIPMTSEKFWLIRNVKRLLFQRMVLRRHQLFKS